MVNSVVTDMEKQLLDMDSTLGSAEPIFALITLILNIIYGVLLACSILCGICGTLLVAFKMFKLRYVLHSCWCLFSLVMIITFLLSGIMCLISIIGFDLCEWLHGYL